ncbi:MAG: UvrD-helicase domain-containing protein [Planctomycetota bacterium]|jgi:superfamily I DNA/RNA helicase
MTFLPTPAHLAIRGALLDGDANLVLAAVAGSGKTSTILWLIDALIERGDAPSVLYTSFARRNIDDVNARLPREVAAKTMHALGLAAIARATGKRPKVDNRKVWKALDAIVPGKQERAAIAPAVRKLIAGATAWGVVPSEVEGAASLMPDTDETWDAIAERFGVDTDDEAAFGAAVSVARKVLASKLRNLATVDFDDMLLAPVAYGYTAASFGLAFIDEAQDLSPVQQAFLALLVDDAGRVVIVGDDRQAIYGFRGADCDALGTLAAGWDADRFPLARSYRCPQAVARLVQPLVPHFEVAEGNVEGEVADRGEAAKALRAMRPTDAVLCRNNAPLVSLAYQALAQRIPVRVLGRDLGAGLLALIKRLRPRDLTDLAVKIDEHERRETKRFRDADQERKVPALVDKCDCLRVIVDGCDSLDQVASDIEHLFVDDKTGKGKLTLSSVHKSKGLEWDTVWVLDRHLMPSRMAKTADEKQQERNLQYVAFTRTKERLFFVDTATDGADDDALL